MKPKVIFIIGVNGVGKSTLLPYLKSLLPEDVFETHDFDERGVPDNADKNWRINETVYWTGLGEKNKEKGLSTLVCGFIKPYEIIENSKGLSETPIIFFLDADKETIETRIKSRYLTEESIVELNRATGKSVEKFIMDNVYISSLLKKDCEELGCKIINTNDRTPEDIAREISKIILSK